MANVARSVTVKLGLCQYVPKFSTTITQQYEKRKIIEKDRNNRKANEGYLSSETRMVILCLVVKFLIEILGAFDRVLIFLSPTSCGTCR